MPGKVFVYIQAYNSEKTIRRAIDSIINQTYQDFECLVCNNGSTDKTEEIIKAYQKEDSRIHLVSVEQNSRNVFYDVAMPIFFEKYVEECEFFCNLDSDDEYLPDFFQNSITFMNDNNLDIAMGGIYFRDARTLETIGQRFTDEQVIIEGDNFSKLFPIYHQYMRTIWGKLYRCSVIKQMDYLKCRIVSYGADSLFAQEAVIKSNRVGILNQFIHIYYLSHKSVSSYYDKERIYADSVLFDFAIDMLVAKCGFITEENMNFLYIVYKNALLDTMKLILKSNESDEEKIDSIYQMVTNHYTRNMCLLFRTADIMKDIATSLCSLNIYDSEKTIIKVAEVLAILGTIPEVAYRENDSIFFELLLQAKRFWFKRYYLTDIDVYMKNLVNKYVLINNWTVNCLCYFNNIVKSILSNKYSQTLEQIIDIFECNKEFPTEYFDFLIDLGLNVAAQQENQNAFIYIKKIQIKKYINFGEIEQAVQVMEDWDELLPEDKDFKDFRIQLNNMRN